MTNPNQPNKHLPKSLIPTKPFQQATFQATKQAHIHDPNKWVQLSLPHVALWSKQQEILTALIEHKRVAVRSCHDSGKSFVSAIAAARWLDVHPAGQARVVTTAPTAMQVKAILWGEINQLHSHPETDLPGRTNQTEWWIGSYLAGVGRKPNDYSPSAFQGLHARYILIIVDEASGVPNQLIEAVETLATNVNARILMIGNPDDPTSLFADIHNNPIKHGYHTIRISAWDTPNFTTEHQEPDFPQSLTEMLLSTEWVEQRRLAWGEQHPFWLSKVEAEFPPIDTQSVIKLENLIQARVPFSERQQATDTQQTNNNQLQTTSLGVDVAGSDTGDETICRLTLPGNRPTKEWRLRSADPTIVTDFIVRAIIEARPQHVVVDTIGVGWGIFGSVRTHPAITELPQAQTPNFVPFNASTSPRDKMYGNARAELWWTARLLFQDGQVDTSNADNQLNLEAQLLQPRYFINKGKIFVEPKEEIKKRIGRSPDNADAFLYSLLPIMHSQTITVVPTPQLQLIARHATAALTSANTSRLVRQR